MSMRLETALLEAHGYDTLQSVDGKSVINGLMKLAATAPDERLDELENLLDAAIAVNEGKGQLFILKHRTDLRRSTDRRDRSNP